MIVRCAFGALLAWLALAGCTSSGEYPCDVDSQCVDASVVGVCQEPGWCSFPDDACGSGQRYGGHAGGGLAGMCVADDVASTGPGAEGTFTTASETTDPGSTSSPSTTTPLTTGVDTTDASITSTITGTGDTSSTSTSTTEPGTGDASSTEDSTTEPQPVCSTYIDDFEDAAIGDEWSLYLPDYIEEINGALVFDVTAAEDEYPSAELLDPQDLSQGWVRAQIGMYPATYAEHLFVFAVPAASPNGGLLWILEGDHIYARFDDPMRGWIPIGETAFDPQLHRWLQIRGDGETVHFEVASDDLVFDVIGSYEPGFALDAMLVGVFAGNYDVLLADVQLSVEQFEVCSL